MNESHGHYADEIHGAVEEHHRHYDTESEIRGLRDDLNRALERIRELEDRDELDGALDRIAVLEAEAGMPVDELRREAYADDEPEPEDYDPGPECDDEGGMSEYRHALAAEEPS